MNNTIEIYDTEVKHKQIYYKVMTMLLFDIAMGWILLTYRFLFECWPYSVSKTRMRFAYYT